MCTGPGALRAIWYLLQALVLFLLCWHKSSLGKINWLQLPGLSYSYWRIYSFDDTIGWGIYRFDAFVYNLAVVFKKNNLCRCFSFVRAVGVLAALVLLHLPWHKSSIGKTIYAQVLGLCESYWKIYSLDLMVVGEIICEQFLRLCGAEGLSTALVFYIYLGTTLL